LENIWTDEDFVYVYNAKNKLGSQCKTLCSTLFWQHVNNTLVSHYFSAQKKNKCRCPNGVTLNWITFFWFIILTFCLHLKATIQPHFHLCNNSITEQKTCQILILKGLKVFLVHDLYDDAFDDTIYEKNYFFQPN